MQYRSEEKADRGAGGTVSHLDIPRMWGGLGVGGLAVGLTGAVIYNVVDYGPRVPGSFSSW